MTPRVLFVDAEPRALKALKDGLSRNRARWEMHFALGAEEALAEFARAPCDVVVSDMGMPGMDGAELLGKIREPRPLTARIVLTGDTARSTALRSASCAHRLLAKPCEQIALERAIEAGLRLSSASVHPSLKALVGGTMTLPSPPTTYLALADAMRDPDASVEELAAIVERDSAMTAQVLRVVNSPLFGARASITRIPQALAMLGWETVRTLVLGVDVLRAFKRLPAGARLATETHHDHSLLVARIAAIIAKKTHASDAFTAAMLHDVGLLLMATITPDALFEVNDAASERNVAPHVVERETWGSTHAEIGAYLLGLWGLPTRIVQAVADHHDPPPYHPEDPPLSTIVHVADALAHERTASDALRLDPERCLALGIHDRLGAWRHEVSLALDGPPRSR